VLAQALAVVPAAGSEDDAGVPEGRVRALDLTERPLSFEDPLAPY
jgi:hypothetical protein